MRNRITLTAKVSILTYIILTIIMQFSYAEGWSPDIEWTPYTRLTEHYAGDLDPSIIQTIDRNIWVVWHSFREGDAEIFFKIYNGFSWTSDTRLTWNASQDLHPSITQTTDGNIWVVWHSDRTGDKEIFCKVYDGSAWSSDNPIVKDKDSEDWGPSITQATDENIWVVWTKNSDVFYKIYTGTYWTSDYRLTTLGWEWHPSIMQTVDGNIWIVWDSFRNEDNTDIYYKIFNGSWSSETKLTTHGSDDDMPSIMQAQDNIIWIAWTSPRIGGWNIYYKKSIDPLRVRCDMCGVYEEIVEPIPDGQIDLWDFLGVAANVFTEKPTWHPIWGPACDVNQDDYVDMEDLMIVGLYFGKTPT